MLERERKKNLHNFNNFTTSSRLLHFFTSHPFLSFSLFFPMSTIKRHQHVQWNVLLQTFHSSEQTFFQTINFFDSLALPVCARLRKSDICCAATTSSNWMQPCRYPHSHSSLLVTAAIYLCFIDGSEEKTPADFTQVPVLLFPTAVDSE